MACTAAKTGATKGTCGLSPDVQGRDKECYDTRRTDLLNMGIVLAGPDVIGDRLTEVNVTRPKGAREIEALTGAPVARVVVERILGLHARRGAA